MKHTSILATLIFSALCILPVAALDVTITVKGIRNDNGKIAALAFPTKNGFPDSIAQALAQAQVDAHKGTVTITLKNVPAGKIAITVLHDENGNGKLNRNFLGIPLEGVGMSGKAVVNRPPTFDDAVFEITKSKKIDITLKYW